MTSQRAYLQSHPWLTFTADLRAASPRLWIMLGECQSMCGRIASVPLRPDTAVRLHRIYLAKGALATTAIEGNTLSENEVLRHLEGKLELPPSRKYLAREIDNIVEASNRMLREISEGVVPDLCPDRIRELNRLALSGLEVDEGVVPGELRFHSALVGRYRGAPAEDCAHLLEKLCAWISGPGFSGGNDLRITNAIIKAALAHLYLSWIHPFGDGNGRTARLVEFRILISSGVPAVSTHLLSNHYNLTRTEYYRQLDRAGKSGDVVPFIQYVVQGFLDGLRQQLEVIRELQREVTWRDYIHEFFRNVTSESDIRRRHLILDLSPGGKPVPLSGIPLVSTRLAQVYATKNERTLLRDLEFLIGAGLVEKGKEGYRAKREVILGFQSDKTERI
jgi:Fic family protein